MTSQRRFGLGIAVAAALLVAIVLQWRHVLQRRQVDRVEVALEQATLIRMSLARAALARARVAAGDPTAGRDDAIELLDRAQLALADWTHGRPGSSGVRRIYPLADTTLRPIVNRLAIDVQRYRTILRDDSTADHVAERIAYTAVAARADSIFFLSQMAQLQRLRLDVRLHAATMAATVFAILLLTGLLSLVNARADAASTRNEILRALAEALAAARTPTDVARATHRVIGQALGSPHGATGLLVDGGKEIEIIETFGYGAAGLSPGARFPNEAPRIIAEVLTSQRVQCLRSMNDYLRRVPSNAPLFAAHGIRAIAMLPLVTAINGDARAIGAISFDFEAEREFDRGERQFLDAVASVAAQAMERALATQDVETARAQAQGERERLGKILDRLPVGVIVMDEGCAIVHQNAALSRHLGHPVIDGASIWSNARRADGAPYAEGEHPLARALRDDRTIEQELSQYLRPDGTRVFARFSIVPIRLDGGTRRAVVATIEDVTNRESLEAQLRQAQKMEAVGRLAGGIAHDFNNLLTVIGGVSDLLLRQGTLSSSDRADVEQVRESSRRAAELTRQLLAFSRQQTLSIGSVDLAHIVEHSQKFIRRVIGEHISVTVECEEGLPRALADTGALEQALMNLVVNARDAMPDGGELRIRVFARHADPQAADPRLRVAPGFVCIAVADTGTGIDPAIRSRIFDPFFTTKEVGKGTGLGLSMVYGLIEQMRGWIELESMMGAGTTFLIYLPMVSPGAAVPDAGAPSEVVARGSETILLVEDEAAVRRLAHRALVSLGYSVLEAPDAVSALRLAESHPHIDLLVTDVVLPGRSGASLADELVAARPELRVLFMSGYTSDDTLRRRLADGVPFLAKPYTPSVLASRVREVLDGVVVVR